VQFDYLDAFFVNISFVFFSYFSFIIVCCCCYSDAKNRQDALTFQKKNKIIKSRKTISFFLSFSSFSTHCCCVLC